MISRSGKPLGRYFPEVLEILGRTKEKHFVVDGELILPLADRLDFEALQMRLHPAESRIRKLATETPAQLMLFDVLAIDARGFDERPLVDRRKALEAFHKANAVDGLLLSPATTDRGIALGWLKRSGGALDGVVAKRLDQPYRFGERAMIKVKQLRTADCVVGGFRYAEQRSGRSGRFCSVSTTIKACCIMSASRRGCRQRNAPRSHRAWRPLSRHPVSLAMRPAGQAAGPLNVRWPGSR